jgi:hypothetical protein
MDIVTLLMDAKKLGLDIQQLLLFGMVYYLLRRDLMKVIDNSINKLVDAINSLEKTHDQRLSKIEVHVGLKKGDEK